MTPSSAINQITVVIDFQIYGYLFQPIIADLQRRGVKVHVFSPAGIQDALKQYLGDESTLQEFHLLDPIKKANRLRFMAHRAASLLFTREDFSFSYMKKRRQINLKSRGIKGVLLKMANFTPKVANHKINGLLHRLSGVFLSNPFPTRTVLVGSQNASAELLGASGQEVYTIMESWDHPLNTPTGYRSKHVFVWTQGLGEDWERCQGDKQWSVYYPLKLRYAIEQEAPMRAEAEIARSSEGNANGKRTCVYAVASTDKFSGSLIVDLEKRIIQDLCEATLNADWNLLIKHRPNGREGEFDPYVEKYGHVSVTSVTHNNADVPANYIYNDEINKIRFDEVRHADVVFNAFTTFGLDAAVSGYPVIQMDLTKAIGYEDSSLIFNNNHIRKYLLARKNVFTIDQTSLRHEAEAFLRSNDMSQAEQYSKELQEWLLPQNRSSDVAVKKLLDHILSA